MTRDSISFLRWLFVAHPQSISAVTNSLAVLAALFALYTSNQARDLSDESNQIAREANRKSDRSNRLALSANEIAKKANRTSVESNRIARQDRDAAEKDRRDQKEFDSTKLLAQASKLLAGTGLGLSPSRVIPPGDLTNARILHGLAMEKFKNNPYAYVVEAQLRFAEGNTEDTRDILLKGLATNAKNAAAYDLLGRAYAKLEDVDKAETAFRKAITLNPNEAMPLVNLAKLIHPQGRVAEALKVLESAVDLQENDVDAHFNLGVVHGKQGNTDKALHHYQVAIGLDPNHALAHNNYGLMLKEENLLDAAIVELRTAWRLNPKLVKTLRALGIALLQKNDPQLLTEARNALLHATAIDPKDATTHLNYAIVLAMLAKSGDLKEAIAAAQKAVALRLDYAKAHSQLWHWLQAVGQKEEAEKHRLKYRELTGKDPKAMLDTHPLPDKRLGAATEQGNRGHSNHNTFTHTATDGSPSHEGPALSSTRKSM